jgi:hypothetical protein
VLDFGGSWGHFLADPHCKVPQRNYWAIDVRREPLEHARQRFPEAHWVYYNRWNPQYNPTGNSGELIPDFGVTFDVVIARSVFTHTMRSEMIKTVRDELVPLLSPSGVCVLTLFQTAALPFMLRKYARTPARAQQRLLDEARQFPEGFYLINNDAIEPLNYELAHEPTSVCISAFYAIDELTELWPTRQSQMYIPLDPSDQCVLLLRDVG